MPEKDSYLNFQNYKKMFPVPFVIYADFESFTQKIPFTQPNPKYFYTFNYQKHKPSGYCIYVKSNILNLKFKPFVDSKNSEDDDDASNFVYHVEETVRSIYFDYFKENKPMIKLTQEEGKTF